MRTGHTPARTCSGPPSGSTGQPADHPGVQCRGSPRGRAPARAGRREPGTGRR
ncbi:hypothetical protein HBB16_05860 [Pseudonocardia sp. MCCB 268]|nr:hypothetical protein [Pseudonocardia cytotoxica]